MEPLNADTFWTRKSILIIEVSTFQRFYFKMFFFENQCYYSLGLKYEVMHDCTEQLIREH